MAWTDTPGEDVLLLGFGDEYETVADRLRRIGHGSCRSENMQQAMQLLHAADPPVRAVLLPPHPPLPDLPQALQLLSELSLVGPFRFVVVGKRPAADQLARLRGAGVVLALWEPFTKGELRFVVNHARYNPRKGESRTELRVPTRLVATVQAAAGEKQARVYNLSEGGAFLETPRPSQLRAEIRLELALPDHPLCVRAEVVTINVPGDRHNPMLPEGMGVRFRDLDDETREALQLYVHQVARSFQL